jgi:hypothetical protein
MSLEDYLTLEHPLGPVTHDPILRRSTDPRADGELPSSLLSQAKTFDINLENVRPIVMGRRGAGKTAFVTALLARAGNMRYYFDIHKDLNIREQPSVPSKTVTVLIQAFDHLDELVNRVGADCLHSLGGQPDWDQLAPETAARHWARHIWHVVFQQLYNDSFQDELTDEYRTRIPLVFEYIEGDDIAYPRSAVTNKSLDDFFRRTRDSVLDFLDQTGRQCQVIIDSIDRYPVYTERFSRVLAGFLRFLSDSKSEYPRLKIYCCLPEELSNYIRDLCANEERDFSYYDNVSRLIWRPHDLLKVVAERYRTFYYLNIRNDAAFYRRIENLDYGSSGDLKEFFDAIVPREIVNRFGKTENTISYIIRHTQLLPRQVLTIFSRAIKLSQIEKGSWRNITADAVRQSIGEAEPMLARNTLKPFRTIHAKLIDACPDVLSSLTPICTLSDLDRIEARFPKEIKENYANVWQVLYEMGVIGYVKQDSKGSSNIYERGCFHFNSDGPITFSNHLEYCVHPIFSGSWHLNRVGGQKFVYPEKVSFDVWSEH